MTEFASISQEEFVADIRLLAASIEGAAWQPDFLVGIGRGGLVPGVYLSHATGVGLLSVDYSAQVFGFSDELLHKLAAKTAAGKRLLLVDDINDSGTTIAYVRTAIAAAGGVADELRVAVVIDNIRSSASADYRARTIDRAVDKRWFIFPWESMAPRVTLERDAQIVPERLA